MVVTETNDTLTQVACADCDKLATLNDDDTTYECDTHGTDSKFKLVSRPTLQFKISGERNDTPSKKDIDITAQVANERTTNSTSWAWIPRTPTSTRSSTTSSGRNSLPRWGLATRES